MPGRLSAEAVEAVSRKIPGIRRIPALMLIEIAEIVLLARNHARRLEPDERRRVLELLRIARGRRRNLTVREQDELAALVAKAEPRLFFGLAAQKLSPLPLPGRVVRGPKRRQN